MSKDRYKRRTPKLHIRDRMLILCGGSTEEEYFNQIKKSLHDVIFNIDVIVDQYKRSSPTELVNAAIKEKTGYHEVWVVFDKDDFTDFDSAISLATKNGIRSAFSNEAFEYWFLLHIENRTGAMTRVALKAELERKLGFEFDKSNEVTRRVFKMIKGELSIAEERAQIGHERHIRDSGGMQSAWQSCTTVYMLTRRLRSGGK